MKLNGLFGTGTGKLGASVFSVNSGVQVVRQYQSVVANPSTSAQVNQRARLKLMSQLAASMAPVIAIPKNGLQSSRNLFIKKNFASSMAANGTAQITLENIQLTDGNAGLPQIAVTRNSENGIVVELAEAADAAVSRVVYIIYKKTSEQNLQFIGSQVQAVAGANGTFSTSFDNVDGELLFLAYGMRDSNAAATAAYGNMNASSGVDVANLVATRQISFSDYQFTKTRGATLSSSGSAVTPTPSGSARVYVTANGNGQVSGAGTFTIGEQVTVTATPDQGSTFTGWKLNGSSSYVSTSATYTFTLQNTTDLVAVFNTPEGGGADAN